MSAYTPELGQACFGQPTEDFEMPRFAESMFDGIMFEVRRVFGNMKQEQWHDHMPADFGKAHVRPYSWGDEDAGPNFWVDSHPLRIRWYKHPGRGMSANMVMDPAAWAEWHDLVMNELREAEGDSY